MKSHSILILISDHLKPQSKRSGNLQKRDHLKQDCRHRTAKFPTAAPIQPIPTHNNTF